MKKIIIVDTGNANFLSIKRAVEKYEKNVLISNDKVNKDSFKNYFTRSRFF